MGEGQSQGARSFPSRISSQGFSSARVCLPPCDIVLCLVPELLQTVGGWGGVTCHRHPVTCGSLAAYAVWRSGFLFAYLSALLLHTTNPAWEAVKLIRTWDVLKLL